MSCVSFLLHEIFLGNFINLVSATCKVRVFLIDYVPKLIRPTTYGGPAILNSIEIHRVFSEM
jgi:hypothetical protein